MGFQNSGFGLLHKCPCSSFSGEYPQATMQYMAAYNSSLGFYLAAHDSAGASKTLDAVVATTITTFSIGAQPPNAGRSSSLANGWMLEYPIIIGVFSGDWWDAAQLYRAWALQSASWTQAGPIAQRKDVPQWLLDLPVW